MGRRGLVGAILPRNVGAPQLAIWRSVIKDNQDYEEILYAPTLSLPAMA
jgi:hypothetical protein